MKTIHLHRLQKNVFLKRQTGVSLFIALVALVALMLASLALIRSVDTSTVIAGNLAFKQAATIAGDRAVENAKAYLTAFQLGNASPSAWESAGNLMNITDASKGYYSNADSALDLFLPATWTDASSQLVAAGAADAAGNTSRYIVQRMCRTANQIISSSNCLFNYAGEDKNEKSADLKPTNPSSNVLYRITVQIIGPRNTVSYIQAFIF